MKKILVLTILVAVFAGKQSHALSIQPFNRDVKFATQQMIEHQSVLVPQAASTGKILGNTPGDVGSGAVVVTSFLAQPDVARNLVVTPNGTVNDRAAGNVVIVGTDILGHSISESFAISSHQVGATVGNLAFASVSSVSIPAENSPYGAVWSVGTGSKLGLKRCMNDAGNFIQASFGGAFEASRPTVAADPLSVSKNTIVPASGLDGAHDVQAYFMQDYRCFP